MIVVGAWEPKALPVFHLVALDAVTGQLLWRTQLFSGAMFPALRDSGLFDFPLGAALPAIANGKVYFAPCMGVIACVDLFHGQVLWMKKHPTLREYGPEEWAGEFVINRPMGRLLVQDSTLMVATRDQQGVLFFDAHTGDLLRDYLAIDFRTLIACDDNLVFVQKGMSVAAVRIADASLQWETSLPTSMIYGRPTLSEHGILCSTRDGCFVISPKDGEIVAALPAIDHEPVGNLVDLGDRLVGCSPLAVHTLAENVTNSNNWHTPRTPGDEPIHVTLDAPDGSADWALPAPDRGRLYFSEAASNLAIFASWETYELRQLQPAPSLLWEFPAPSWPAHVHFDQETVVLNYHYGLVIAIDVDTGRERWRRTDHEQTHDQREGGLIVADKVVLRWKNDRLQALESASGEQRWGKPFAGRNIRGICLLEDSVGVVSGHGRTPKGILLDLATGEVTKSFSLAPADYDQKVLICRAAHRIDVLNHESEPFVLFNTGHIGKIDWRQGQVRFAEQIQKRRPNDLLLADGMLVATENEKARYAFHADSLKPIRFPQASTWSLRDRVCYYSMNHRITAYDLDQGKNLWQSTTFMWDITSVTAIEGCLLVTHEFQPGHNDNRPPRAEVVVLDRSDGQRLARMPGLADSFHLTNSRDDALYATDSSYVYRFSDPDRPQSAKIEIKQPRSDPHAIAAIALARSINEPLHEAIPLSEVSPVIDGASSEWTNGHWTSLRWPDDWRPDHALLDPNRRSYPVDHEDISARFAVHNGSERVSICVEVTDDVHAASPHRTLAEGDSVQIGWRVVGSAQEKRLDLLFGIVDQVPLIETGRTPQTSRVTITANNQPSWLRPLMRAQAVPWLTNWQSHAVSIPGIRFAGVRNNETGRTLYELSIPASLLPAPDPKSDQFLAWDIMIHDADGRSREGALEAGTGLIQFKHDIGYVLWGQQKDDN
jgi:outer membrane protein assembly factor BamB